VTPAGTIRARVHRPNERTASAKSDTFCRRGAETKSRRDIHAARTHDFTLCTFYNAAQISKVASFRFAACKKRTIHARAKCEAGANSRSRIPSRYFRLMHSRDSINSVRRANGFVEFLKFRCRLFRAIRLPMRILCVGTSEVLDRRSQMRRTQHLYTLLSKCITHDMPA